MLTPLQINKRKLKLRLFYFVRQQVKNKIAKLCGTSSSYIRLFRQNSRQTVTSKCIKTFSIATVMHVRSLHAYLSRNCEFTLKGNCFQGRLLTSLSLITYLIRGIRVTLYHNVTILVETCMLKATVTSCIQA